MKFILIAAAILASSIANADVKVRFQNTPPSLPQAALVRQLQEKFGKEDLREITVRPVFSNTGAYLIARLHSAKYHKVETVKLQLDGSQANILSANRNYRIAAQDRLHSGPTVATCPDESIEFIAMCPNDIQLELDITKDVYDHAVAKGLKSVLLLKEDATRQAYLNYMSCPNLKGNFYDGDSNPYEMVTADDSVTAEDFKTVLKEKFRFKVTNIWLACQAFNDPMLSSLIVDAQAQKYAAGINNLLVGPSDRAAACTMKKAINGEPMKASFDACYKEFDTEQDKWGFDGRGSDFFGQ